MNIRRVIVTGLAALMLAACNGGGAVYEIPVKEMRQKLLAAKPPAILFGSHYVQTRSYRRGDGSVVWSVSEKGEPLFRFIAATEEVDAKSSRISLEIAGPTDDANDPRSKRLEENPHIARLYLRAMEEAIDSKLTNRQFDMSKFQAEMMAAAMKELPNIKKQVNEAAAASAEMNRMMAEAEQSAADAKWEREIESQWQE